MFWPQVFKVTVGLQGYLSEIIHGSMDTANLLTSLSKTNSFKFSFMKRIVGEWNSLPLDIRQASSVED